MRNSCEKCRQWADSRIWDNGWKVNPDESIDAAEWHSQYEKNKELWDKLFAWLATADLKSLQPGKVVLVPDRLWVNVLEYTPKDAANTKAEAHRNFIDLQYTYEGNELMGLTDAVEEIEPYNPVKDVTKYRPVGRVDLAPASADRFFLYFPKDLHQPSIASCLNPGISRKIVGKIEYAK